MWPLCSEVGCLMGQYYFDRTSNILHEVEVSSDRAGKLSTAALMMYRRVM